MAHHFFNHRFPTICRWITSLIVKTKTRIFWCFFLNEPHCKQVHVKQNSLKAFWMLEICFCLIVAYDELIAATTKHQFNLIWISFLNFYALIQWLSMCCLNRASNDITRVCFLISNVYQLWLSATNLSQISQWLLSASVYSFFSIKSGQ